MIQFAMYLALIQMGCDASDFPDMPEAASMESDYCVRVIDSVLTLQPSQVAKLLGGSPTLKSGLIRRIPSVVRVAGVTIKTGKPKK